MKIFLDTANIEEIREGVALGVVDGVTTNPSLLAREGSSLQEAAEEICDLVEGPISLECVTSDAQSLIEEGRKLSRIDPNVVVKVPMIREGMKALRVLAQEGIPVNVTLVFSAAQALIAAKNGAAYVSPFVGRIDDISGDGMQVVAEILNIYDNYAFETEVLVASVRHPRHVLEAARLGADIATVPYKILEQLLKHPLTDIGQEKFLADHRKANQPVH